MAFTASELRLQFAKAVGLMQANEVRKQATGIAEIGFANQASLIGATQVNRLKQSVNQPTKIYLLGKNGNAAGSVRKCEETGNGGSRAVDVTYATAQAGFAISHDELAENEFTVPEVIAHELAEALRRIDEQLDAAGATFLNAEKSAGSTSIYTPEVGGEIFIPKADYDLQTSGAAPVFLNKLTSQMAVDKYMGNLQLIGDPVTMSILSGLVAQGQGNATNLGFQFLNWASAFSNNIAAEVADYAKAFIMPQGHYSLVTWAKNHASKRDLGTKQWYNIPHPTRPNVMLEVVYSAACADNSGTTAGAQADMTESWSISVDYAYVNAGDGLTDTGIRRLDFKTA